MNGKGRHQRRGRLERLPRMGAEFEVAKFREVTGLLGAGWGGARKAGPQAHRGRLRPLQRL